MVSATRIIVLNTTKVGERSMVVHAISPEFGRRSFIVSVSSKSGAMARWQPLSILSVEVTPNAKSDLWRLSGASALYSLNAIRSNMYKSAICMFMAEVLFRTFREGVDTALYEWCEKSILTLDSLDCAFANFHLRWLLELCSAMGFAPSLASLEPFAGQYLSEFKGLLGSFEDALTLPLNGSDRSDIALCTLEYLSLHLEYHLDIKSLPVLSELFK